MIMMIYRYFEDVSVCNLTADSLKDDSDDDIGWKLQQFHGKWIKGVNAGGCTNYRGEETFLAADTRLSNLLCRKVGRSHF